MPNLSQHIVLKIYRALPRRRRRQFWLLFGGILGSGMVEMVTMGVVALFASSLTDPQAVLQSGYLAKLNDFLGFPLFTDPRTLIIDLSVSAAVLLAFKNAVQAVIAYLNARFSAMIDAYFGERLLLGFLHRRYEWHLSANSSDLVTAVIWRRFVGNVVTFMAIQAMGDGVMVLLLVATLLAAAPVVSLSVFTVLGGTAFLLYAFFRPMVDRLSRRVRDLEVTVNRHVTKALHGIKDVKVFRREGPFLYDYNVQVREYALSEALVRLLMRSPTWILEAAGFGMLAMAVLILLLVLDASLARITGTVALLAVAAWRILPAVNRILNSLTAIRQSTPQAERIFEYLEDCAGDAALAGTAEDEDSFGGFDQAIEFRDVSFSYQGAGHPALNHVNLVIRKGDFIGLVGRSGAGKSTFVDLLIGLLPPQSGCVMVDGAPLEGKAVGAWLSRIGYVSQSPYIYDATLAQNVAFGLQPEEVDGDKVLSCCIQAGMDDFIDRLPQGIDTPIGERGAKLSGGQRQRVAIARALYRDPDVLILDEATSALDQKSEDAIQHTVLKLSRTITVVVIAHRLSTVEECGRIVWMEQGRVHREGPAGEVLAEYRSRMLEEGNDPNGG